MNDSLPVIDSPNVAACCTGAAPFCAGPRWPLRRCRRRPDRDRRASARSAVARHRADGATDRTSTIAIAASAATTTTVSAVAAADQPLPPFGCAHRRSDGCAIASAASESIDGVGAAMPPGTAATGRPPLAPYWSTSGSCDDGTEKRT